ncbi:hypothetical protein MHK_009091 [Candidatus Magnetomorum sp. HK-1]|nr:hypothetical protein MHK_009091 [Candidatus Magnetomorum sp. HK-1]
MLNIDLQNIPGEIIFIDEKQTKLSKTHLLPNLDILKNELLCLRKMLDQTLYLRFPMPRENQKPYPYGRCLEITQEILRNLSILPDTHPLSFINNFQQEGGVVKRIWGDLRGLYFQNAIQMGMLYVDVSNDTVDLTKPKVEIKELADSGFTNFSSYEHYACVGERYIKCHIYPNFIFPWLAPIFPVLIFSEDKKLSIALSSAMYFLGKNIISQFQWAYNFLFTSQFSLKKLDKEIYTTLYKTVNKKEYLQNMIQVCSFESRNKPIYKAFDQIKQMADQNGMHIFEQYLLKKIQEVKLINRELMW